MKTVTGNHILRILKCGYVLHVSSCCQDQWSRAQPAGGRCPKGVTAASQDLYFLIKKAVSIRKHLDKNRKA